MKHRQKKPNKRLEPTRLALSVYSYASDRAAQAQRWAGDGEIAWLSLILRQRHAGRSSQQPDLVCSTRAQFMLVVSRL